MRRFSPFTTVGLQAKQAELRIKSLQAKSLIVLGSEMKV